MRVFQMYCLYSSRTGRLKLDLAGGAEAVVAVVVEVVRHAGHEGVLVHHSVGVGEASGHGDNQLSAAEVTVRAVEVTHSRNWDNVVSLSNFI